MKIEDVELLEFMVEEEAGDWPWQIRGKVERMAACSCAPCSLPISLAGSARGFEVLIVNELINQLIGEYGDELNDLDEVFGSVKGLKAFQKKFKAKCLQ
ncbi:hypothetical protein [Pseudomonas putida]|uniref:hypothetical protein n=1 Tax=Pseudomonas putida TaxID=303 RepID=UPI003D988F3E